MNGQLGELARRHSHPPCLKALAFPTRCEKDHYFSVNSFQAYIDKGEAKRRLTRAATEHEVRADLLSSLQTLLCNFCEDEDINQVLENAFNNFDTDHNKSLSGDEILKWFESWVGQILTSKEKPIETFELTRKRSEDLKKRLETELKGKSGVDVKTFTKIARGVGIAEGQRFMWVRQFLNLDGRLARQLRVGNPFDEYSGLREMGEEECDELLRNLVEEVAPVFKAELKRLKQNRHVTADSGTEDISAVRSKFFGFDGKFGDTEMFQEGLESQLGHADPLLLKGILREHSSTVRKVTSNYKIDYSDKDEYARVFGHPEEYEIEESILPQGERFNPENGDIPIFLLEVAKNLHTIKGPGFAELRELKDHFKNLRKRYDDVCKSNTSGVFPGENGHVHLGYAYCEVVASNSDNNPSHLEKTVLQSRRRVGLRELMKLEVVEDAKLRLEEALQAYQYTGPLFQVLSVYLALVLL